MLLKGDILFFINISIYFLENFGLEIKKIVNLQNIGFIEVFKDGNIYNKENQTKIILTN